MFALISNMDKVNEGGINPKYSSSLGDYRAAAIGLKTEQVNVAEQFIDNCLTPFLISLDALEMDIHPFIEIYDVYIKLVDGNVGVATQGRDKYLPQNTMVVWMNI